MLVTHELHIDLTKHSRQPVVAAVQGEANTRQLAISLFSNSIAWAIPDGATAAVAFLKPDGTRGLYDKLPNGDPATTLSGNTVSAILAPQALTCAGTVLASVVFYDQDMDTLATFPFRIIVEKNPAAGEQVSNNYYTLQNLDQVNQAYTDLLARVESLETNGGGSGGAISDEQIAAAVNAYLEEHPVAAGATAEEAAQIEQNRENIDKLAGDKLDATELPEAVNAALAQAKASGEFKGDPGAPGTSVTVSKVTESTADGGSNVVEFSDGKTLTVKNGSPGYTPQKGKDYHDGEPGEDGVSPVVAVSKSGKVTTISITDKNGTKTATINDGADGYTPVKGKDYFDGDPGAPGTSVTVSKATESTEDGGSNVVAFSDGKTLTVKNGKTGAAGKTAYQYAQDGGYIGTEAEFAEKLANEYNPNPLHGKKVSFVGDSICAGNSTSGTLGGYGKIIADRNNMVYENLAQGGATVTAETYSSTTGNAKGWISRMVDNMSADADYAIVEGGVNDAWQLSDHGNLTIGEISIGYDAELDDTTYYGAFESMLKKLVTRFKGKKIGYIAIPKTMELYDSSRNAPNFYHIALECCAKWGVSVCDLNTITPPTKFWGAEHLVDGTHPTYDGYLKYYCDPIEAWMKTLTTGASVSTGAVPSDLDDKYVSKNDISIKKAQLTLVDGSTVLIDVVVASEGTTIKKYTNKVPISTDTDGNIFNGVGYQTGYRLSSSGATKEQSYSAVTGFIPAKANDVIYITGCGWYHESAQNYLCAYKADFSFIGAVTSNVAKYGTQIHSNVALDGERGIVTLADVADIAYIRVSAVNFGDCEVCESLTLGEDMIVTVNEEIT